MSDTYLESSWIGDTSLYKWELSNRQDGCQAAIFDFHHMTFFRFGNCLTNWVVLYIFGILKISRGLFGPNPVDRKYKMADRQPSWIFYENLLQNRFTDWDVWYIFGILMISRHKFLHMVMIAKPRWLPCGLFFSFWKPFISKVVAKPPSCIQHMMFMNVLCKGTDSNYLFWLWSLHLFTIPHLSGPPCGLVGIAGNRCQIFS